MQEPRTAGPCSIRTRASLSFLGRHSAGVYDEGAAEIPAYHADSQRLFVVNGSVSGIDVLDVADPMNPTKVDTIETAMGGPNNISVYDDWLVAAIEGDDTQSDGAVTFFDVTDLSDLATVEVGPLPDMVNVTDDGNYVLTANEGEPNDGYSTDPAGSVSIIDISRGVENASAATASFSKFDGREAALRERGIRIYGPDASAAQDLEPEYIATADGTAYVTLQENNALAIIDIESAEVTELVALGYKDHSRSENALDAIADGAIDITTQPVYGMYQPDTIRAYEADGETYLLTANEGDAREYDAIFETGILKRVGGTWGLDATEDDGDNIDVEVDPSGFDNGVLDSLAGNEFTTETGDTDDDGVLEELHLFGARSFSIFDTEGTRVYESGDELERLVADEQPEWFNSDDGENDMDSESAAAGPEPEGIATGSVAGTPYAFIGFEEISAVATFDVSDPLSPTAVDYINTRNFDVDPESQIEEGSMPADAAGDLAPEGLLCIPAADSPIDDPLLAVCYELSGTTSLYRVRADEGPGDDTPALDDVEDPNAMQIWQAEHGDVTPDSGRDWD